MIREAIILAGGLGTRLRAAVPDLPKCMAPVAGHPFIYYLISYLRNQGISRFIFSLGFKHAVVETYLAQFFVADTQLNYVTSIEKEPLGTGGAILKASLLAHSREVLVVNGDTFFAAEIQLLYQIYKEKKADCILTLKPMQQTDRYGVVTMEESGRIRSFLEKQFYKEGLINGGVYLLNTASLREKKLGDTFSFENNYLLPFCKEELFYGVVQDHYFIDIGIPADYQKANEDFKDLHLIK